MKRCYFQKGDVILVLPAALLILMRICVEKLTDAF